MSAYSWGLEISRKSDAILRADAMPLRSDEITWWNTHKNSLILLTASVIAFSSANTAISINW